jgi:DDE family transposase
MSHRDRDCRNGSGTNAQRLRAAIDDLLADVDWKGIVFREDCGWTVRGLMVAALIWTGSRKESLKGRFQQSLRLLGRLGQALAPVTTSYQAFMKMLVRWTAELRACLTLAFQLRMECEFPNQFRTHGFVLVAGDGSKLQLARTRSNEARYAPARSRGKKGKKRRQAQRARRRPRSYKARAQQARDKKADSPQMALTLLYHVMLRLPWDWRLGPSDSSERDHLRDMIPHLPPDALVAADCGFVGYEFWSDLLQSGREFVIRVGGNVHLLKKLGRVRESNGTIYLWPHKTAKRGQEPLALRLVVVHDGRQPWYLVTSVRSTKRLSDKQVADIYCRRWRIELFFRHFKQTFNRAKLRSHKAEHAVCEAEWSLLGMWAMLLHTQILHQRENGEPSHLSVAKMLHAFRQTLDDYRCRPERGESLEEQLLDAVVDSNRRRNKTSRDYPRKKYETQAKPPQVRTATPSQRRRAKQATSTIGEKGLPA